MRIIKRTGKFESFNEGKIVKSVIGALRAATENDLIDGYDDNDVDSILFHILKSISILNKVDVDIETMQDIVETVLMELGYFGVAKEYIHYRSLRSESRKLIPDSRLLSDYIHMSKYSKEGESYEESIDILFNMHSNYISEILTSKYSGNKLVSMSHKILDELEEVKFEYVLPMKVLPSMRSLQCRGSAILAHHACMYNCSATKLNRTRAFGEILYLLLCGCGVGYSVQQHHVDRLNTVTKIGREVVHFSIPDTIEGWADAINVLIHSYITPTYDDMPLVIDPKINDPKINDPKIALSFNNVYGKYVEYDYSGIRSEGTKLVTKGGVAPGHLGLKASIEQIRNLLDKSVGRRLRPIECHDIVCHLADAVLSGGIRRSSLIALFDSDDMLYAKDPSVFTPNKVNPQRSNSNNSRVILRTDPDGYRKFKQCLELSNSGYAEPGAFFTNNVEVLGNPCMEIALAPRDKSFGFCNLNEINCSNLEDDYLERCRAAAFLGTIQSLYTDFKYLHPESKQVAEDERLLGVSMTGIHSLIDTSSLLNDDARIAPSLLNDDLKTMIKEGSNICNSVNKELSEVLGIKRSKRITCTKPSGTASLLLGSVPNGIHPIYAKRYIRRVTANPNEYSFKWFRQFNEHMVQLKDNGDYVISFPIYDPKYKLVTTWEQLELIFDIYDNWILPGHNEGSNTHNISNTLTIDSSIREEQMDELVDKIWANRNRIGSMSYAPELLDKKYPYAPFEKVATDDDLRHWNNLIELSKTVKYGEEYKEFISESDGINIKAIACEGDKCLI